MKFFRYIIILLLGILVSFFFFPITFKFFPEGLNTKIILGVLGCFLFIVNCIRAREILLSKQLLGSIAFATIFSGACLASCEINDTLDYTYATYIVSFFSWLMSAYMVCELLRMYHGVVSLPLVTKYLVAICVAQCIIALLIDNIPIVKIIVDSTLYIDNIFFDRIDRLYGIGAALDPAGIKFSVVVVLIFYILLNSSNSKLEIIFLIISFFIISVIGNIISRTTSVGVLIALSYFVLTSIIKYKSTLHNYGTIYYSFFLILTLGIIICIYLYNTNMAFNESIRFAFEGFFNWYENGEWRTDSTDKLNANMWVWPTTTEVWLCGTGIFGSFAYETDIGYCRFILYCGIVGFSIFCGFFIYNSWAMFSLRRVNLVLAIILLLLVFVIWIKVATDIFFIYALLYCLDCGIPDNNQQDTPQNTLT